MHVSLLNRIYSYVKLSTIRTAQSAWSLWCGEHANKPTGCCHPLNIIWKLTSLLDDIIHDDVIKWKHFPCYWLLVCGEFTGQRWITLTKPVTRSFDAFFDLCQNKRLSKQLWGWWFETPWRPLWRHSNVDFLVPSGTRTFAVILMTPVEAFKKGPNLMESIQAV